MKYQYQAKTKEGELQVGMVEAGSRDSAIGILTNHGLYILSLVEASKPRWYDNISGYLNRVRIKELTIFSRQLATLLEARLPLNLALQTLYNQTSHPLLKQAVGQVVADVSAGLSFSQALERQADVFPGYFISMIRSAEVVGNLDEVSTFLANYMEKEYVLTSKARSAMIYPIIIVSLFLIVAFVMIAYVFPQIGPVFAQAGVELPIFSQIMISVGQFLAERWLILLVVLIALVGILIDYARTPEGRALIDEFKLRAPLVRRVFQPITITRVSNVIAMLLRGGVPVVQATEIAGQTIGNLVYRDILDEISQEVRQGKPISQAIANYPEYFPPLMSQMLVVGEASGQTDKMFLRLAEFYNREADSVVGNLVELIQPALMVGIGCLVGLLFASILLPLYQLTATIR